MVIEGTLLGLAHAWVFVVLLSGLVIALSFGVSWMVARRVVETPPVLRKAARHIEKVKDDTARVEMEMHRLCRIMPNVADLQESREQTEELRLDFLRRLKTLEARVGQIESVLNELNSRYE